MADEDEQVKALLEGISSYDEQWRTELAEVAVRSYQEASEPQAARSRGWFWRGVGVGLALAAAALVFVLARPPSVPQALPPYEVSWQSGVVEERGADEASARFVEGSKVELWLRPATAIEGDVEVVVFVDDWTSRLAVDPDRSSSGALLIRGTMGEPPWALEPGAHELWVAVGRGEWPAAATGEAPSGWQVYRLPFDVQ